MYHMSEILKLNKDKSHFIPAKKKAISLWIIEEIDKNFFSV